MNLEKEDGKYSQVSDFCLNYLPKGISDFSVTVENRIFTSATTVKAGVGGAGILAHEIAHRLNNDLDGEPDADIQKCLMNRHFESLKGDDESVNRELYLREDFADRFSSQVLRRLKYTAPQNNFVCPFFSHHKFEEYNQVIPILSSESLHPLVSEVGDVHSSDTFRLLQMAEDLGHLTPVCQDYLRTEGGKTFFENSIGNYATPSVRQCNML